MVVEAGLFVAVWIGVVIWIQAFGGAKELDHALAGNRAPFYGALSAVLGALFGFVIASIAIVLPYSDSELFAIVRESGQSRVLWRTFSSALLWLALATPVSLAALLIDRDTGPNHAVAELCFLVTGFSAIRLGRVVWIFSRVLAGIARVQSPV